MENDKIKIDQVSTNLFNGRCKDRGDPQGHST